LYFEGVGLSVGRNTIHNLGGTLIPIVVSLATTPAYLHLIGLAGYGALSVVWMVLVFFTVFDPGLSRATAYEIARRGDQPRGGQVLWTALALNASFGIAGGALLLCIAQPVFTEFVKMPTPYRPALAASLPWLAAAVPLGTITAVLNGALQGRQKFALINMVNSGCGVALQIVPLGVAWGFGAGLAPIIASAVLVRLATALVLLGFVVTHCGTGRPRGARLGEVKTLFAYGSWISISSLIVPFLMMLDKLLIASWLGVADVTIYALPDSLTRRLSIVPSALVQSLFPRFAAGASGAAPRALLETSFVVLLAILAPVTVAGIVFMHVFFRLWLGAEVANKSGAIGEILLVAIFVNSLAYLPSAFLQAAGRPSLTAKFHLLEIIPHILFLLLGLRCGGLLGVACAMLAITLIDASLLFAASRMNPLRVPQARIAGLLIALSLSLAAVRLPDGFGLALDFGLVGACSAYMMIATPGLLTLMKDAALPAAAKIALPG